MKVARYDTSIGTEDIDIICFKGMLLYFRSLSGNILAYPLSDDKVNNHLYVAGIFMIPDLVEELQL